MMERNVIEVAPLAFMRGRTLNDAFIIMDEAQNTTSEQMKMFLTRLGSNSKAVITGDVTQIDLPNPKKSGLVEAIEILRGVDGIRSATSKMAMSFAITWCSGSSVPTTASAKRRESCPSACARAVPGNPCPNRSSHEVVETGLGSV